MTPHLLRWDGMYSHVYQEVSGFQAEVWGSKKCMLNPQEARLPQELLHSSPATHSTLMPGRPDAVKQGSCQLRVQARYPRSGNAAEVRTWTPRVKTGWPRI